MKNFFSKWFDNSQSQVELLADSDDIDWTRIIPFIAIHLACLFVFYVGFSWVALLVCVLSYVIRMFAITAFYHRYFSHKSFKTSRIVQGLFAVIGATATQRGPIWWAAHHRHHHIHADGEKDTHSPRNGFWHSHLKWFLMKKNFATKSQYVKDLEKFPELRFIDRFDILFPIIYATGLFMLGSYLAKSHPELGSSAGQMLIWGYFISTVLLSHITYCINSLAHIFGFRTYETQDDSRNNFILAIFTLGEGWHNNHHCNPGSVKQGFTWWQLDFSYYILWVMNKLGLVWDMKAPNPTLLAKKQIRADS
ncbi:acyl-CoA desaturase [Marinicella sp. S1101]|uniref:acyl-CoA desaturase n=1 Tax=Marinicella marina TaxID=2996016 RepID=UPI002260C343|nr:acyl-CoA desaturase [Marinicella marina]MCX7553923.1 acyl-CoA desaturase [Marinicella marina]MDJ1140415.1 acyl-CoA desaturase [Marinicella marina]